MDNHQFHLGSTLEGLYKHKPRMGLFSKNKDKAGRGRSDSTDSPGRTGPAASSQDEQLAASGNDSGPEARPEMSSRTSAGLFGSKAGGFRLGGAGRRQAEGQRNGAAGGALPSRQYATLSVQDAVGRFCGLPDEDWNSVLDLSDLVSSNETAAKDAAEAIRKEFKHGSSLAQERAAKLLVVMMRNTTERFKLEIANKKVVKTIEDTVKSNKTDPRVRAVLFKAVGLLAFEAHGNVDLQPIVNLYIAIKPAEAPLDGIPLEEGDTTFDPIARQRSSRRYRGGEYGEPDPSAFDPQVQMQQLLQRASVAKSEAGMLADSLGYTPPEEVKGNEIVQEFYAKVLSWQEFVVEQLPWAQAEADKSHRERSERGEGEDGQTEMERVLDVLLAAHSEIHDSLALYHRMEQQAERKAREEAELREAEERSKAETKFDRQGHRESSTHEGVYVPASPERVNNPYLLAAPVVPVASTSSSHSSRENLRAGQNTDASNGNGTVGETAAFPSYYDASTAAQQKMSSPPPIVMQSRNPFRHSLSSSQGSNALPSLDTTRHAGTLVEEPDPASPSSVEYASPAAMHSNNPFLNRSESNGKVVGSPVSARTRKESEEIPVPREPSAKALGKLRRFSGIPVDADEQQRRLEEALRQKYEQDFVLEDATSANRKSNGNAKPASATEQTPERTGVAEAPRPMSPEQRQASILDEYDPFR